MACGQQPLFPTSVGPLEKPVCSQMACSPAFFSSGCSVWKRNGSTKNVDYPRAHHNRVKNHLHYMQISQTPGMSEFPSLCGHGPLSSGVPPPLVSCGSCSEFWMKGICNGHSSALNPPFHLLPQLSHCPLCTCLRT